MPGSSVLSSTCHRAWGFALTDCLGSYLISGVHGHNGVSGAAALASYSLSLYVACSL